MPGQKFGHQGRTLVLVGHCVQLLDLGLETGQLSFTRPQAFTGGLGAKGFGQVEQVPGY